MNGALQKYEKKRKTAVSSESEKDWKDVNNLLDSIENAAGKTKGKCNKTLHKKTISFLDDMMKQVALERNTAKQMIALAQIDVTLQRVVVEMRKMAILAKKSAPFSLKINMTLAKMNRALPQWLKDKDKKNLSAALRTFTELKSAAKKIKPVSDGNFEKAILNKTKFAKTITNPPASIKLLVKEILLLQERCLTAHTAASEAQSLLSQKFDWFESELKSLTA